MRFRVLPSVALFALSISGCMEQGNQVARPPSGLEPGIVRSPARATATSTAQRAEMAETVEPTGVITLKEALGLALVQNPELRASYWGVRVADAGRLQASLRPNPELEVEVEEVGGAGDRSGFDGAETTIQIAQPIELGQKRAKRTALAALEKDLAQWDYEAKRLDVRTEVTKAFVEVLAAQQRVQLTEELLKLSQELLETVAQRVDAGKDSPLEKTKAAVVVSNSRIQHEQAIRNLQVARKQLASTWAAGALMFERAAGRLDSMDPVPLIEALTDSIARNPDIARWAAEIEKAKAALEVEKAKAVSDISLSGGFRKFNETDDNAAVFGVSLPLGVSDRNQGGRLQATYNLARAREEEKATRTRTRAELVRAYHSLSNAYAEAIELENNILQGAETVFEASKEGYSQGKLDYLNVLDAQRTLSEVRTRYIDALAAYHSSKADVERLIGEDLQNVENPLEVTGEESK
ncbi:MAG: TolC family protein [Planctomycetota bacterium]